MKILDVTTACQLMLLLLSFTHNDARQHWLSGPVTDPSYSKPGSPVQKRSLRGSNKAVSPRFFDFTISLHSNPQGDNDGSTQRVDAASADQDTYEEIIQFMADAIYEATEGAHKLRKVRIFRNNVKSSTSDITWKSKGHPSAHINGITSTGLHIYMYDDFNGHDLLKDRIGAGYTLAHEYGHYALGVFDEYVQESGDVRVEPSIMSSQWNARNEASQSLVDSDWLQFSIKRTTGGKFQNTLKTAQHRMYNESAWETLSRLDTTAERLSATLSSIPSRVVYSELAAVAPTGTNTPSSPDLPGTARSDLEIIWEAENLVYEIVIDSSGSMDGTKIDNALTAAKLLVDLAEVGSAIGVIRFSSTPSVVSPITNIPDQATKNSIKAAIDLIGAGGGTSIGAAAQLALNQLQSPSTPNGTKVVFLLSDGMSFDDALAPIPAYQAAQVPIFAFSYGDDADTETLRAMAEQTKGQLYISPISLAAVSQAFQDANTLATSASNVATGSGTAPSGAASVSPLIVDSTLSVLNVVVTFPGVPSSATVNLVAPDSTLVQPDQITESGGETLVLFTIENPLSGEWQISVTGNTAPVSFDYQVSGLPTGVTVSLAVDALNGNRTVSYPEPFVLTASLGLELPVLNANVEAILTAPDGTTFTVPMNDAGTAPDSVANDGWYSAAVKYDQSGIYDVLVRVLAEAGVAVESAANLVLSAGVNGEFVPFDPDSPLTETFERFERIQVEISGVVPDDHGNTFGDATTLPADNSLVPGIIETAGDVDVFSIPAPADSGEIAIRVSNLALGMDPLLSVFDSAEVLIVERKLTDFDAQGGYVVVTVPYSGGETFYAKVSHQLSDGVGWYQVSAGSIIFKDLPRVEENITTDNDECAVYGFFAFICYILKFLEKLFGELL
jgi:uncharacterized protein YegL